MGAFRSFIKWRPYTVYDNEIDIHHGFPPIESGEILQESGYRLLTEDGNFLALEEGN